jgi:hypothetical protein
MVTNGKFASDFVPKFLFRKTKLFFLMLVFPLHYYQQQQKLKMNKLIYRKLEYFLENEEVRKFTKFGKVYCFDEDHIRAEFFLSSSECEKNQFPPIFYDINIFDCKDNFGYLTSCPTNSRKGNKVSALLDLSELSDEVKLNIINKYKENIIKKDNLNEKIIFFLKNYDKNILLVFFNIVINIYNLKLER